MPPKFLMTIYFIEFQGSSHVKDHFKFTSFNSHPHPSYLYLLDEKAAFFYILDTACLSVILGTNACWVISLKGAVSTTTALFRNVSVCVVETALGSWSAENSWGQKVLHVEERGRIAPEQARGKRAVKEWIKLCIWSFLSIAEREKERRMKWNWSAGKCCSFSPLRKSRKRKPAALMAVEHLH